MTCGDHFPWWWIAELSVHQGCGAGPKFGGSGSISAPERKTFSNDTQGQKSYLWCNFYQFLDLFESQFEIYQFWKKIEILKFFENLKLKFPKKSSEYLHLVRSRSRPNFFGSGSDQNRPAPAPWLRLPIPAVSSPHQKVSWVRIRCLMQQLGKQLSFPYHTFNHKPPNS